MKKFLSLLLLLLTALGAQAKIGDVIDLGAVESGKVYDVTGDFSDYTAHFVATESGTLTITSTGAGAMLLPYADEAHTSSIPYTFTYLETGGCSYDIKVAAGETYYFYKDFCMETGTITFLFEERATVKLVNVDPADGSLFSLGGIASIFISFNRPVVCEKAVGTFGTQELDFPCNVVGNSIVVSCIDSLTHAIEQGWIQPHEHFQITLTGIASSSDATMQYNDDGILTLRYELADPPVTIVDETGIKGKTFLSFWPQGDERAIFSIEFSDELLPVEGREAEAVCSLGYGNPESETADEYHYEVVPYWTEGRFVKCDFSGRLRRPQDLVASGTNYGTILLQFSSIKGADGSYAAGGGEGSLGSFAYYVPYQEVSTNIITEFTPLSGAQLDEFPTVELWVADFANVRLEGFEFSYQEGDATRTLSVTEFEQEADADFLGASILTIPVPAGLKGMLIDDLVLTAKGLVSLDGVDHSEQFTAHYKMGDFVGLTPASAIASPRLLSVFDAQGKLLRRTHVPTQALEGLPAGIYIINGVRIVKP